jgi:hypothetical protein
VLVTESSHVVPATQAIVADACGEYAGQLSQQQAQDLLQLLANHAHAYAADVVYTLALLVAQRQPDDGRLMMDGLLETQDYSRRRWPAAVLAALLAARSDSGSGLLSRLWQERSLEEQCFAFMLLLTEGRLVGPAASAAVAAACAAYAQQLPPLHMQQLLLLAGKQSAEAAAAVYDLAASVAQQHHQQQQQPDGGPVVRALAGKVVEVANGSASNSDATCALAVLVPLLAVHADKGIGLLRELWQGSLENQWAASVLTAIGIHVHPATSGALACAVTLQAAEMLQQGAAGRSRPAASGQLLRAAEETLPLSDAAAKLLLQELLLPNCYPCVIQRCMLSHTLDSSACTTQILHQALDASRQLLQVPDLDRALAAWKIADYWLNQNQPPEQQQPPTTEAETVAVKWHRTVGGQLVAAGADSVLAKLMGLACFPGEGELVVPQRAADQVLLLAERSSLVRERLALRVQELSSDWRISSQRFRTLCHIGVVVYSSQASDHPLAAVRDNAVEIAQRVHETLAPDRLRRTEAEARLASMRQEVETLQAHRKRLREQQQCLGKAFVGAYDPAVRHEKRQRGNTARNERAAKRSAQNN